MKRILIVVFCLSVSSFICGQNDTLAQPPPPPPPPLHLLYDSNPKAHETTIDSKDSTVFMFVQHKPKYTGEEAGLFKFLQREMKYPEMEKEMNIQGTVVVQFIVEKDGTTSSHKVIRGVEGGPGLSEESLRISKLIKFETGAIQADKYVRLQYNIPFKFSLSQDPIIKGMWEYPQGEDSLQNLIKTELMNTSVKAKDDVAGKVKLLQVIDVKGNVKTTLAEDSKANNKTLNKEALRAYSRVKQMKWSEAAESPQPYSCEIIIYIDTAAARKEKAELKK